MLNFYITIITVPGLYDQLFLVKKLQRVKVETCLGGHFAVLVPHLTVTRASQPKDVNVFDPGLDHEVDPTTMRLRRSMAEKYFCTQNGAKRGTYV